MDDPYDRLGRFVSDMEARDAETSEELELRIQRVGSRFRESFDGSQTSALRGRFLFVGAFVVALGILVGVWAWPGEPALLRVYADSDSEELTGAKVGSAAGTKQLNFTDGTRLSLYPQTLVQVVETTESGATVRLEKGRAFAAVVPREGGRWRLEAGPYVVQVTGTEFDLAWDPDRADLELAMHRGSVILTGPNVPGELVVQGREFVRFRANDVATTSPELSEEDSAARMEPVPPDQEEESSAPTEGVSESGEERAPQASGPRTARQLWDAVQQHRKSGDGQAARAALIELRSRHGARGQTAYLLGRVHADLLGSTSEAVHWFEMYLKEAPGGSLSEQALGRLIELQSGTPAGSAAAERYLRGYPDGSYAVLARSALRSSP